MTNIPITDEYTQKALILYEMRKELLPKNMEDMVEMVLSDMTIADIVTDGTDMKNDKHIGQWAMFYWIYCNWEWIHEQITIEESIQKNAPIHVIILSFSSSLNIEKVQLTSLSGGIRKYLYEKCKAKLIDNT